MSGRFWRLKRRQIDLICTQSSGEIANDEAEQNDASGASAATSIDCGA
jgi:hypothetical protein